MITAQEKKDIEKMRYKMEIESDINILEFQRKRIFEFSPENHTHNPGIDADYYMILLKRLYRKIEDEQHDSRVANLKGKFPGLHRKIQIRNHFEHGVDLEKFPHVTPGIIVVGSLVINDTNPHIISGNQVWLLNEDHEKFKKILIQFADLYPFAPKPEQKTGIICHFLKGLMKQICKKNRQHIS